MAPLTGHLRLCARPDAEGRTVLASQSFRAPFHLSKPYWDGITLIVQVVNPTAGILENDQLESAIEVAAGGSLLVTTPSASRIFKMQGGEARSRQEFRVGEGGWLEYLPEPLVPHQESSFSQTTLVELARGAELFFGDLLMPGRIARGEAWSWRRLCLDLTVRVEGRLILRERFDQTGAELKSLAQMAGFDAGACLANLVVVSRRLDDAGAWRRELMDGEARNAWLGVSPLSGSAGGWSIKLVAADSVELRKRLSAIRKTLASRLQQLGSETRKL